MIKINSNKTYNFLLVHCAEYRNAASTILSLQCLEILKNHFKHSSVYFLSHSSMQDFFTNNPFLSNTFFINDNRVLQQLKDSNIDIAISLFPDKASTIAIFRANIKTRIGIFSKLHSLLFNYKIKQKRSIAKQHELLHNISLLKPLGCSDVVFPKIYLSISEKCKAQRYVENNFSTANNKSQYIAICPSNAIYGPSFGWLTKNFLYIANILCKDYNILVIATQEELDSYKDMLKNYEYLQEKNIFNASFVNIDTTPTRKIIATLSCASMCIANNNVLLHTASTFDVPTISFFPYAKAINPMRYMPLANKKIHTIVTPLGIFDPNDSKNATYIEHKDAMRVNDIPPDLVIEIINNAMTPRINTQGLD